MVSKITDPFNATAVFEYDYDTVNPPQLTAITDALQLRSTISFDGQTLQWITPYGTNQVRKFFTTDLTYGAQMAALVTELGVRTNLYAYGDINGSVLDIDISQRCGAVWGHGAQAQSRVSRGGLSCDESRRPARADFPR